MIQRSGALVILVFLGLLCLFPARVSAADIDQMIGAAKTPEDHEAIAAYFERQAAEARSKADEHLTMAAKYEHSQNLRAAGPSYWRIGVKDCEALRRGYQSIADQDTALAKMHREISAKLRAAP